MNPLRRLLHAWQHRGSIGDQNIARDELEFLPAALEIEARPPSPAGRWLMWALMALFVIGVIWTCFGKVDIVVMADGKIVPNDCRKGWIRISQILAQVAHSL